MPEHTKTALVTGAGSGIGKAVTLALFEAGFRVVLTGRRIKALESVVVESGCSAGRGLCVAADIGKPADVDQLFEQLLDQFGRLDLLFNNAGIASPPVEIDQLPVESWLEVVNTNLTGAFLCARRAFGIMKQQKPVGGRIINNGSVSAQVPRPLSAPYTATKHGITGLTRSLALDGRSHNIACGQIDIGNAHSEMAEPLGQGALQANGQVLAEPLIDVDHVARSVLHMAQLPLDANILFVNVMATQMPYVGRG